jgi:hypothetical protein
MDRKGVMYKTCHLYIERLFKYANNNHQLKPNAKHFEFFVTKLTKHAKNDGKGGFTDSIARGFDAINPFSDEPVP